MGTKLTCDSGKIFVYLQIATCELREKTFEITYRLITYVVGIARSPLR